MNSLKDKSAHFRALAVSAIVGVALSLVIGAFQFRRVEAQVPSPNVYNTNFTAITNAAQVPATVNSATLNNIQSRGAECTYNQTAITGSPSTTISIQWQDPASGLWQTMLTSAATTTAINTPSTIWVYPGITAASNVSISQHLPRVWRAQEIVGGTGSVTGTLACGYLN